MKSAYQLTALLVALSIPGDVLAQKVVVVDAPAVIKTVTMHVTEGAPPPPPSQSPTPAPPAQPPHVDEKLAVKLPNVNLSPSPLPSPSPSPSPSPPPSPPPSNHATGGGGGNGGGKGSGNGGGKGSGNGGGNGAGGGASCGSGCAQTITFTGTPVDFVVGLGQANVKNGNTGTDNCLCFQPGSTRVVIGTKDAGAMATLFEGNAGGDTGFLDVSYVQGYNYPMVCTGSGGTSGCSTDLYSVPGASCPSGGSKMGDICANPQGPNGHRNPGAPPSSGNDPTATPWCQACSAPDDFFKPCAGAAYTYPYDDTAMASGSAITCCIGTDCPTRTGDETAKGGNCAAGPGKRADPCTPCEGTGSCTASSKRTLEQVFERAPMPMRPRSHTRSFAHRHAAAHKRVIDLS